MSTNSLLAKILRFVGIVLMGLTAGFTLLGGVGTSCVAINPDGFGEKMARLAPFQWLYIIFVLVGLGLGVLGIRATVSLVKGAERAYHDALYVLIAGVVVGVIHIYISRALRGSSMPVDAVLYTTALTLILFLLFRIPAIWQHVNFTKGSTRSNQPAGGSVAIILGIFTLTIPYTMGSTHTWNGVNYAHAFNFSIYSLGTACLLLGAMLLARYFSLVEWLGVVFQKSNPLKN